MKIFITGGGGYIGSSLIQRLQENHEIVCFDHGSKYESLKKFFNKGIKRVRGEVTDRKLVEKEMRGADVVIHFAGPAGNHLCINDPVGATKSHAIGTHVVLQSVIKNSVDKFFFASTQSVYTTYRKRTIPFTEDMSLEPDDFYGTLKTLSEYEIQDSATNYVILRFANVYGYGNGLFVTRAGAIGNFIKAALSGSDITIFGTGEQGIDYVNIDDVGVAIELLLNKPVKREIFNIGSGKLTTIMELASHIVEQTRIKLGRSITIKKMPVAEGAVWPDRLLSIKKIHEKIGWSPKVSIKYGIAEILERSGEQI